jgi:Mitochondrial genome maintenance MGM101
MVFRTILPVLRLSRLASRTSSPLLSRTLAYTPYSYTRPQKSEAKASTIAQPTVEDIPDIPKVHSEPIPEPKTSPFHEGGGDGVPHDWSKSYHGLSSEAFTKEVANILMAPIDPEDVEMKPGTTSPLSRIRK